MLTRWGWGPSPAATVCTLVVCGLAAMICGVAAGPALAAGGDESTAFQADPAHDGALTGMQLATPLSERWSYQFADNVSFPIVADGSVYVVGIPPGSFDPELVALNQATGAIRWTHDFGDTFPVVGLTYDAGRLFAVDEAGTTGTMTAFDAANGSTDWTYTLPYQWGFYQQPIAHDGVVYYIAAGDDGTLYAVSESGGDLLWTDGLWSDGPFALDDGGIYVDTGTDQYAIDAATGGLRWEDSPWATANDVPVAAAGDVFFRDTTPGVFSANDGTAQGPLTATQAPAVAGGVAYVLNHGSLDAFADNGLGAAVWSAPFTGDGSLDTAPLLIGDTVWVGSSSGELYAVDDQTGDLAWSTQTGGAIPGPVEGSVVDGDSGLGAGDDSLVVNSGTNLIDYVSAGGDAAPASQNPPSIEGLADPGQQLAADVGSWSNMPQGFAYQWLRCDTSGEDCAQIAGATAATYAVTTQDEQSDLEVQVAASGDGMQSAPVVSAPVSVQTPPIPAALTPPSIIGSGYAGDPQTAAAGSWTGAPTAFTYQWQECDASGSNCAPISGATSPSYTPAASDIGCTFTVTVTAGGAGGTGEPATSGPIGPIKTPVDMTPPASTQCGTAASTGPIYPKPGPELAAAVAPPSLTGAPVVGTLITAYPGHWVGTAPVTYAYQWMRCQGSCTPVPGASGFQYRVTTADEGYALEFVVTVIDPAGSVVATAGPTAAVPVPPTTGQSSSAADPSAAPATSGSNAPAQANSGGQPPAQTTVAGADAALVRRAVALPGTVTTMRTGRTAPLTVAAPVAGRLTLEWFWSPGGSRRRRLIASVRLRFGRAGKRSLSLRLTAGGRRDLHQARGGAAILAVAEFVPVRGRTVTARREFRLAG